MRRAEIIRMAREAQLMSEFDETSPWVEDHPITEYVERFAALVAAAEREACVVAGFHACVDPNESVRVREAIRARGQA